MHGTKEECRGCNCGGGCDDCACCNPAGTRERTYQSLRQQSTAQTSATKSHAIVDDNVSAFPGRKGGCGGAAGSRGDGGGCAGGGGDRGTGGRGGGGKSGVGTILGVAGGGADIASGSASVRDKTLWATPKMKSARGRMSGTRYPVPGTVTVVCPVKRHRGEPGHTRNTHGTGGRTRAHGTHRQTSQPSKPNEYM